MDRKNFLEKIGIGASGTALLSVISALPVSAAINDNSKIEAKDVICANKKTVETAISEISSATVDNHTVIGQDAKAFDKTKAYAVGQAVLKDNKVYICKTATTANQDWNAEQWDESTLSQMKQDVTQLNSRLTVVEEGQVSTKCVIKGYAFFDTINYILGDDDGTVYTGSGVQNMLADALKLSWVQSASYPGSNELSIVVAKDGYYTPDRSKIFSTINYYSAGETISISASYNPSMIVYFGIQAPN